MLTSLTLVAPSPKLRRLYKAPHIPPLISLQSTFSALAQIMEQAVLFLDFLGSGLLRLGPLDLRRKHI